MKLVQINDSRYTELEDQFTLPYFQNIIQTIKNDKELGKTIYPKGVDIFKAFDLCGWDDVRVVILGQDPYHGKGQAHGLCFSVSDGIAPPPSLINIYKEIESEYPESKINYKNGNLTHRTEQGVLLLNAFLTVEAGKPLSHSQIGWEQFTDHVIKRLSESKSNLVFMLWGNFALSKSRLIDSQKHLVLTAAHPSPFSAYK
jgi:uracil-DNA glycosylase